MYGLNPHVYGENNSNSPYYKDPCLYCKYSDCEGCPHQDEEYDPCKRDEDAEYDEWLNEFYADNL